MHLENILPPPLKSFRNINGRGSEFYKSFRPIVRYPRTMRMMSPCNDPLDLVKLVKYPQISSEVHFLSVNYRCF